MERQEGDRRGGEVPEVQEAPGVASESGGRAVASAPSALGSDEQSSWAFQSPAAGNPLGGVSAAEDPSAERGREGSVACSRHDESPAFPKRAFQERCLEGGMGFTFSLGVLVRGHGIPVYRFSFCSFSSKYNAPMRWRSARYTPNPGQMG